MTNLSRCQQSPNIFRRIPGLLPCPKNSMDLTSPKSAMFVLQMSVSDANSPLPQPVHMPVNMSSPSHLSLRRICGFVRISSPIPILYDPRTRGTSQAGHRWPQTLPRIFHLHSSLLKHAGLRPSFAIGHTVQSSRFGCGSQLLVQALLRSGRVQPRRQEGRGNCSKHARDSFPASRSKPKHVIAIAVMPFWLGQP